MKKITILITCLLFVSFITAQQTCATAIPITSAGIYAVPNIVAGSQFPNPICVTGGTNSTGGRWYSYTPATSFSLTITTDIAANTPRIDTRFHVYTGTCGALVCLTGDDDSGSNDSSTATFNVVANTTYYIAFDNRWTPSGFSFQIQTTTGSTGSPVGVTFTSQTITTINSSYNIGVVDMNNDYRDDIVGVSAGAIKVHNQNITPGFTITERTTTTAANLPVWSLAAGDYNKDGFNDLMYGGGSGVTFMRSNETGTAYSNVTPPEYIFSQRTNFIDLNNDGNLDAFVCHDVDPNVYFLNNAANTLTFFQSNVTPGAVLLGVNPEGGNYGSIWVDYDNDGDQDLFLAKCRGGSGTAKFNELHRNNGNGTFTDVSVAANMYDPVQTWSAAWADYDNDGDMDALVGASSFADGTHKYMMNMGNGTFTDRTLGSGWDTNTSTNIEHVAHDFNNDGFVDVMGGGNKIMMNQGNGSFLPFTVGFGVGAVGDLNNDGFLDMQNGNTIRYNSGNSNKWIKISLKGITSNSNGIGARVELYGTWGKQIRDVRSGDGFKYMSSLNVHFGIGSATQIEKVVVKWPSGLVDVIFNPAVNQRLHIVESSTLDVATFTDKDFSLYPNPAKNILNINVSNALTMKLAQVYDFSGRLLMESTLKTPSLDIQSLSSGTYILLLRDENGKDYSKKFIKE
jgi:hypothetical protein